ncbi:hypothetical protein, partial [Mesorhizobium sp.]|uniref:hypothetical protein n=1 Tax=Mesorhizobium sp. TaxID=1871066 RepID=UPI00257E4882
PNPTLSAGNTVRPDRVHFHQSWLKKREDFLPCLNLPAEPSRRTFSMLPLYIFASPRIYPFL